MCWFQILGCAGYALAPESERFLSSTFRFLILVSANSILYSSQEISTETSLPLDITPKSQHCLNTAYDTNTGRRVYKTSTLQT